MQIKILSLNVFMGGVYWQPLNDFLLDEQADIMFLQEVYDGTNPEFGPRLRSKQLFEEAFPSYSSSFVPVVGDLRQNEGLVDNGNQILSRWPLTDGGVEFFDIDYFQTDHDRTIDFTNWPAAAQVATVTLPTGNKLRLVNIHGPVWYEGDKCTKRRLKMAESLNKLLDSDLPTIIAGDSNATPDNPCWKKLITPHVNVFGNSLKTTFNMKKKSNPGYGTASVDVVFTTSNLKITRAECLDVDVSDHLPLAVEIEI